MEILKSIRNWLIELLSGRPTPPIGAEATIRAEDVAFRESPTSMILDDALFERSRTQWYFGDWNELANLQRDTIQNHSQRAKLALLAAAGRLQSGSDLEAREYIALAKEWGCTNTLISQVLISGVHNSLGRAAAIAGEQTSAIKHFQRAIAVGSPESEARLLAQARVNHQYRQLDMPAPPTGTLLTAISPDPAFIAKSVR
jgi:hypothetical protein